MFVSKKWEFDKSLFIKVIDICSSYTRNTIQQFNSNMPIELARQQKVSNIFNTIIGVTHWINCVVKVVIEFVSL